MLNSAFRHQFPFFTHQPWIYLDSAATTLKPQILVEHTVDFYRSAGSVHRSQYDFAQTQAYELARDRVARRFNLKQREAVIWTSGTTESINIVANSLQAELNSQDEIIVSVAEHHANFIPWQQLVERTGAKLIVLPLNAAYQIDPDELVAKLSARTKMVAFNLVSNVTGIRQPAEQLIPLIRQHSKAKILLDIAQAVCSEKVDTQQLGADFYAFSAHKMYGPTGVGVLMGDLQNLAQIRPLVFGGKMLKQFDLDGLTLANLPYRLEAGTPNIAGIVGFGAVLGWLEQWDFSTLNQGLSQLAAQLYKRLDCYQNLHVIGQGEGRSTFSFVIDGIHHADIAAILTEQKIAIRAGEHCAKPFLRYLQQTGTLRLSLAHYNTAEDIDRFFYGLDVALELLQG